MNVKRLLHLIAILTITIGSTGLLASAAPILTHTSNPPAGSEPAGGFTPTADDPSPPASPVKLIFIHHSCGENWLADDDGGLGLALRDNYFVSDTNYGWTVGGNDIGSLTDIGHWWEWFRGADSAAYMSALYTEYGQHSWYSRMSTDPGGENEIIMFKSCYPNSHLGGNPSDPPTGDPNPLRGQDAWSEYHTVANAKGIYNDLLEYFATRQDKLFVVITAPPLQESETDATHAANARAFNDWLVDDWLDGYSYNNVAVFDFYNVLTSNGGDANTNDLGTETGNHHRWWSGTVQHIQTVSNNYSAYPGGNGGGSHPTAAGNLKATGEFVQLLNVYYNHWQGGAPPAPTLTLTAPNGGENWTVGTQHQIQWTYTGDISNVSLAYSTDNFVTPHVIEATIANSGSYDWTVPDDVSTSVRVRVASVVSPTIYDDSNADFTISAAVAATYTFNAVITPPNATLPVTYVWSPAPASGQGEASATYQWDSGTHVISVQATNCGGTVSNTYTYTVGASQAIAPSPHRATAQTTVVFTSTADVTLANDVFTNANVGGLENLQTYYGDAENRRSLMIWDLSALSGDITISAATVELYRYHTYMDNDTEIALYRVTSDWVEGTGHDFWPDASYVPDGATWLTATATVPWTTPGGDYDPTALDQLTIPTGMALGWMHLDATAAVQAWVGGSASNYGLLLRPLSGEWTDHQFYSREAVTTTLRPRLVITYTSGAPAPTLDITAPTGGTNWPVSSTQQIRWNTTGVVTQVNLSYSLGGGFTLIESNVTNSGSYAWTTPVTPTTSARVRVESTISSTISDTSDTFTLSDTGVFTSTVYLPLVLRNYAPCVSLTGVTISEASSSALIQLSDLTYLGAFRLLDRATGAPDEESW